MEQHCHSSRLPNIQAARVHSARLLLLSLLLAVVPLAAAQMHPTVQTTAAAKETYGIYPPTTPVPEQFVLSNSSTLDTIDRLASHPGQPRSQRAVIFTTLRFGDAPEGEVMGMVASFCSHLHKHNVLQHALLITTEVGTWELLRARGLPAYLDRSFPRRSAYVQKVKPADTHNREFDVEKHWWGWRLASLGFRVLYMDSDAVVLRDPLAPFDQPFDVQGLTDWQNLEHPELEPGAMLKTPCSLYVAIAENRMATGTIWSEVWNLKPGTPAFLQATNPCQSTGVWYLQPTPITVAFMRAMVDRIAYHAVYQWDQTAWNEIITAFLTGTGSGTSLRYRVLPFSECSNIETYRARKAKGLPVNPIVLHLGGIYGADKTKTWQQEGLFNGNFSLLQPEEQEGVAAGPRWGSLEAARATRLGNTSRLLLLLLVPGCIVAGIGAMGLMQNRALRIISPRGMHAAKDDHA